MADEGVPKPVGDLLIGVEHRGQGWAQVPSDYLYWMLRQTDMDADTVWHARQELVRRTGLGRGDG